MLVHKNTGFDDRLTDGGTLVLAAQVQRPPPETGLEPLKWQWV